MDNRGADMAQHFTGATCAQVRHIQYSQSHVVLGTSSQPQHSTSTKGDADKCTHAPNAPNAAHVTPAQLFRACGCNFEGIPHVALYVYYAWSAVGVTAVSM